MKTDEVFECVIETDNPVFFANKLIELRDSDGIARIGEFKGTYYAACDGVTAEDIVDAINQEMSNSSGVSPDIGEINESGLLSE